MIVRFFRESKCLESSELWTWGMKKEWNRLCCFVWRIHWKSQAIMSSSSSVDQEFNFVWPGIPFHRLPWLLCIPPSNGNWWWYSTGEAVMIESLDAMVITSKCTSRREEVFCLIAYSFHYSIIVSSLIPPEWFGDKGRSLMMTWSKSVLSIRVET
jgi:hypothetical protein